MQGEDPSMIERRKHISFGWNICKYLWLGILHNHASMKKTLVAREIQGGAFLWVTKKEPSNKHTNKNPQPKGGDKDMFLS